MPNPTLKQLLAAMGAKSDATSVRSKLPAARKPLDLSGLPQPSVKAAEPLKALVRKIQANTHRAGPLTPLFDKLGSNMRSSLERSGEAGQNLLSDDRRVATDAALDLGMGTMTGSIGKGSMGWEKLPGGIPRQHGIARVQPGKLVQAAGKPDQAEELAYNLVMSDRGKRLAAEGDAMPGVWYDASDTYQSAIDVLGDERGMAEAHRLHNNIAATTALSKPNSNWKRGNLFHSLGGKGMLTPEELRSGKLVEVPEGFGHLVQRKTHQPALANVVESGGIDHMTNQKPASFGGQHATNPNVRGNLGGNLMPATIDEVMTSKFFGALEPRLKFALAGGAPKDWAYAPLERGLQRGAAELAQQGVISVPRGFAPTGIAQENIWRALNPTSKGTSSSVFADLRAQSARDLGVSEEQVNDMFWKLEHPMGLKRGLPWRGGLVDPKPYVK